MDGRIAFPGTVRASDTDRERAAVMLRRHYTAGRLTTSELESRIARAYGARWRSDLRTLLRDLPFELPVDRTRVARGMDRFQRGLFRVHLWLFTAFNTVLLSMWAWGGGGPFWPAISLIPGGALLLWHRKGSQAATRRLLGGGAERRQLIA
jgi:hypothetical protein